MLIIYWMTIEHINNRLNKVIFYFLNLNLEIKKTWFMDGRRTVRNYDYTLNILMFFILISSIAINLKFSRSSIMDRISSRPSRESPKPTANGGTVNVFDRLSAGGKSGSKTSLASSRSDVRSSTNNLTAGIRGTTQSRYSCRSKKL